MSAKKLQYDSVKAPTEILSALRQCKTFSGFSPDLLESILPMVAWVSFAPNHIVLSQGQKNSKLFFLVSGKVSVAVDSERVSQLSSSGDVIGEMSIISNNPCSATVTTLDACEMLSIEARNFSQMSKEDAREFQYSMYKIFSTILTEKLTQTNEKARDFEIANRDLIKAQLALTSANQNLEQKIAARTKALHNKTEELIKSHLEMEQRNTELLANQAKLEEANAIKNTTINKLDTFVQQESASLEKTILSIEQSENTSLITAANSLKNQIKHLKKFVSPLKAAYDSEANMASKKVLLLEAKPKEQVIAKMALGGTGVELDIAVDSQSAVELLQSKCYDIVFIGADLIELIPKVADTNTHAKIVFLTSDNITSYLHYLEKFENLSNVVSISQEDRVFTIKNITTTVSKLVNKDLFGLEKYLGWGAEISEEKVRSSEERRDLVDAMQSKFRKLGIRKSVVQKIRTVAEELLMNAIYDAPVDIQGKPSYNHLHRSIKVDLKENEIGTFRYACDGVLVAISVSDPFGALNRNTILRYLRNCYGDTPGTLNQPVDPESPDTESDLETKGGAGLGLFQLLATSDLVIFNVCPGQQTEVIALFNTDTKLAKTHKNPSFHFFYN